MPRIIKGQPLKRWYDLKKNHKQVKVGGIHRLRGGHKRETRFDLYPESWTFFKRDSVISGIELDS